MLVGGGTRVYCLNEVLIEFVWETQQVIHAVRFLIGEAEMIY